MISDLTTQQDSLTAAEGASQLPICNSSSLYFAIPIADQEQFARLPDKVRKHTATTLALLQRIHEARSKSAEARAIAFERAGQRGFSGESLLRKYYRYVETRSWKDILDRAQAGPAFWASDEQAGLPPAFVEFWKALCERNQRKTAPARRALLEIWRTHRGLCPVTGKTITYRKIPGYDGGPHGQGWPLADGADPYPKGWSVANLNRHAPSKFELAVARRGRESASAHRRKVFTTRAGLSVGQFYLFDDQEYDLKVNWPGARNAMRPLGLNALDLYSACNIAIGLKPTLVDEEGAKKKLRERDMLWLVADVLCNKGFRSDVRGTTLIVEHGTAAIRADFEERILAATGGKVTVDRSGLSSVHMPGLFEGQSKGNPRFKAALESLFNLVRNEMAALPGQTGMDRQHAPAQLAGQDRYNEKLLKLWHVLPPHRREQLRFPFLQWHDFVELTLDVYHRINNRTDHELEGWQKCRHFVQEYFIEVGSVAPSRTVGCNDPLPPSAQDASAASGMWLSEAQWIALEAPKRRALEPFVQAKCRNLSPQEVWNRGATELQKLGDHALPILLGPEFGQERSVRGGYITVEDRELDPDPLRFPAGARCRDGEKFLVYLSPHNIDRLILTGAQGRFVGALERQIAPCRADVAGVHRQLGAARKEEAARLAPVSSRALGVAEANRDMHRNNLAVVNGQPITNDELQAAADLRQRMAKIKPADVDEFLAVGSSDPLAPSAQEPAEHPSLPESEMDTFL